MPARPASPAAHPSLAALKRARQQLTSWFEARGHRPFRFQRQVWTHTDAGDSGLLFAPTGTGKTLAAIGGHLIRGLARHERARAGGKTPAKPDPLTVVWLTPLRALAADTAHNLGCAVAELGLPWTVGLRTGDTSQAVRRQQDKRLPTVLVTTPESLTLFLARKKRDALFAHLGGVVVDEWHELLGSKRGTQTELLLAHLRAAHPRAPLWGLSATLGNLEDAARALVGPTAVLEGEPGFHTKDPSPGDDAGAPRRRVHLVSGSMKKRITVKTLLPKRVESYPWRGHLGLGMKDAVIAALEPAGSSLVFTNTRSFTEIWYRALLQDRPDWAGRLAVHHSALGRAARDWVEGALSDGLLKAVVCTSSLDLGVDYSPVEQVLQVGSPKGVARLLQRAGRSGHQPGAESRLLCVPASALELVEIAAARDAMQGGLLEERHPLKNPLDVLVQHVVTMALGGDGMDAEGLLAEVRDTAAFVDLHPDDWAWVLDFVTRGGDALTAYDDYQRVAQKPSGTYHVPSQRIARRHRMNIGTIVSDPAMVVRLRGRGNLGTIEESFISRLNPGDAFRFAGQNVELVRTEGMTAYVARSSKKSGVVPRWGGGRLPMSSALSAALRQKLDAAKQGVFKGPEMRAVRPVLDTQAAVSCIPGARELLIEQYTSDDGHHLFFYPFEGRLVHEGLSALVAYRLARTDGPGNTAGATFAIACNDYGFELCSPEPVALPDDVLHTVFTVDGLADDIVGALNHTEMAKRQFREIARIAGLVFGGYPGAPKSARNVHASSSLMYDVLERHDPTNRLLGQARREVLERHLEHTRLKACLRRLGGLCVQQVVLDKPSPLAFPLLFDRLRGELSTEDLAARLAAMSIELAGAPSPHGPQGPTEAPARRSRRRRK